MTEPLASMLPSISAKQEFMPASAGVPSVWLCSGGELHLWTISLDISDDIFKTLYPTLSWGERARASRFRFEIHQRRFVAGRGTLRTILARHLSMEPGRIEFAEGPAGKPALGGQFAESGLQFNLAHCEGLAILAVAREVRVGVDVERVRVLDDVDDLVSRFFSTRESNLFARLSSAKKPEAFFNLWTRKEALLKATGEGIGRYLNRVEVSFLPGDRASLLQLPFEVGGGTAEKWTLQSLEPAPGFICAVASEGRLKLLSHSARESQAANYCDFNNDESHK